MTNYICLQPTLRGMYFFFIFRRLTFIVNYYLVNAAFLLVCLQYCRVRKYVHNQLPLLFTICIIPVNFTGACLNLSIVYIYLHFSPTISFNNSPICLEDLNYFIISWFLHIASVNLYLRLFNYVCLHI